jgi:small subunit ribosomal protein S16
LPVKIRLTRMGCKKRPFYRIVVANSTSKRDGRAIEQLGFYDPLTDPATVKIDADKAVLWLTRGAQPTETVADLLKKNGVTEQFEAAKAAAKG